MIDPQNDVSRQTEGVAIIGMSCLFPGAVDVDAYWQNILNKFDAVSDPPPEAWDPDVYYDPDSNETDRIYCKRGGYIEDLARFDPLQFGIPPVAVGGEPDQWLALRLAKEALDDAGYAELSEEVRHRTAIILGRGAILNRGNAIAAQHGLAITQTLQIIQTMHPEFSADDMEALRRGLREGLPPMQAETAPGLIPNVIVGRIANRLDLMGPTYTIDAACASSLVSVQLSIRELLNGTCDLVLTGGSHVWTPVPMMAIFCQLNALSRRQEIRPFDKDADGTILGEGIGMMVLKRLSDAERDGDRIYAVVRGVGVASDGKAIGVMAPRVEGEELAMRRAYQSAGVSPQDVGLIEAHGTGTPVGDAAELTALSRVFGTREQALPSIALGTVKSMISHTVPAAGAAGLIKTALALHHKVLPPTIHCDEPNPKLDINTSPLYMNTETRPWISGKDEPRLAAVSAFGFGGINAHVVLEEYRPTGAAVRPSAVERPVLSDHRPAWDSEVCILEAATPAELLSKVHDLQRALSNLREQAAPELVRLEDVAYALSLKIGRAGAPTVRLAVVATSVADLEEKLARAEKKLADPDCKQIRETAGVYYAAEPLASQGKVAFLVPGEGSQYANMLSDLCLQFPEVRECFDKADRMNLRLGETHVPSDYIFPRPTWSKDEAAWAEKALWEMDGAVTSVLAAADGIKTLLEGLGVKADMVAGHSSGEYGALLGTGVFGNGEDRSWILTEAMRKAGIESKDDAIPAAALLAFGCDRAQVEEFLREAGSGAHVAMDNCPHQVVVVAEPEAEPKLLAAAARQGIIVERLGFDRPYHSPLFAPFSERLHEALQPLKPVAPEMPVYSCVEVDTFTDDPKAIRSLMSGQWARTVEFRRTVEKMYADGARIFVEVGPRNNLTSFVEDTLRGKPYCAVASNVQRRSGILQLNHLVGMLAVQGVELDLSYLYHLRQPRLLDLDPDAAPAAKKRIMPLLATGFPAMTLQTELGERILAGSARPGVAAAKAPSIASQNGAASNGATSNGHAPIATPAASTNGHAPVETGKPPVVSQSGYTNGHSAPAPAAAPGQPVAPQQPAAAFAPQTPPPVVPAAGPSAPPAVVHGFLETMDQFLRVQEGVMRAFIGNGGGSGAYAPPPAPMQSYVTPSPPAYEISPSRVEATPPRAVAPPVWEAPVPSAPPPVQMVPAAVAPVVEPAVTAAPAVVIARPTRDELQQVLLEVVSDRTGYPVEVISADADLEADLGIDSIKRVEIIGSFRTRYPDMAGIDFEELATKRSLSQLLDVLAAEPEAPDAAPVAVETAEVVASLVEAVAAPVPVAAAPVDHEQMLIGIVSDRTGYPVEVITLDADLESDLGIDSIKRVEILGTFRQSNTGLAEVDLEQLTAKRTLRQILEFLSAGEAAASTGLTHANGAAPAAPVTEAASPAQRFPLLGDVVTWRPGAELITHRTFDADVEVTLSDHTVGKGVSRTDPDLMALPVMAMVMSLEMLAEGAAALVPGKIVTGLRDIRANRWIAFDEGPQTLEVQARVDPADASVVAVQLLNLTEGSKLPVVEARVVLGDAYPVPEPRPLDLPGLAASRILPEDLYRDIMYHGPTWRAVKSIDATCASGLVASFDVLPLDAFVKKGAAPNFQLDPILVDAAGQVLGFWTAEHLTEGALVFPMRVEAIELHAPPPRTGETATCRVLIDRVEERQVRAQIELTDAAGRVLVRARNWTSRRFYVPTAIFPVILPTALPDVSEAWPELAAASGRPDAVEARRLWADLQPDSGFIARIWGSRILTRRERAQNERQGMSLPQEVEWLAARHAAKEAVQALVRRTARVELLPADIELREQGPGSFSASGFVNQYVSWTVVVTVTQADKWTVAVAALEEAGRPVLATAPATTPAGASAAFTAPLLADDGRLVTTVYGWLTR